MNTIEIYTDGSYTKKKDKINCGYGVYFPNGECQDISRKFIHRPITNNRAELYAIHKAIKISKTINEKNKDKNNIKDVNIYSDSEYSVKTLTIWYKNWIISGRDYLNKDIIDDIMDLINTLDYTVNFIHIRAHTNNKDEKSINNDVVDKLAKEGALK
jgi:ribonuclease HI